MMTRLLIVVTVFMLAGCGDVTGTTKQKASVSYECSNNEQVAEFTLSCIKNANPKSDEEPEDWIRICRDMALNTYCKREVNIVTLTCIRGSSSCYEWAEIDTGGHQGSE